MINLCAVITAYNRADFVGTCIRSIYADVDDTLQIRVVVMDNGSSDDTADVAKAAGAEVLRTEDNRHIVEVINRGFKAAYEDQSCEYIVVMNEDTEYTPGSLRRLVDACVANPDSVLTAMQLNYRDPEKLDGNALNHVQATRALVEDAVMGRPLKDVYDVPAIIGACMMATRKAWEAIGEFDPLFWFYGVDDDICTRARWLGYRTLLVPGSQLLHAHGKLNVELREPDTASVFRKWRLELQAAFLFLLKYPNHGLLYCALRASWRAFKGSLTCLMKGWPRGAVHTWVVWGSCMLQLGKIAATRRKHYDPAKKLQQD